MGFARFNITLDNHSGFFSPGQTITGKVHITNTQVEKLKGIKVECSGTAEVRFPGKDRQASNSASATVNEFCCAKEQYFDAKYSLCNPGSQLFELSIGQHEYPFTFVLPPQIPSSFEGTFGHVRYIVRAVAQRPWLKSEYECNIKLVVCSSLDLKTIPKAALPVSKMKSKTLGCFCCVSGPITAQARIERAGYVPGETIILNAITDNESGESMRGSKAQFVQITKYLAEGETKIDSKIIQVYNHEDFIDSDIMENVPFVIEPHLPPSDLPSCGIINVSYQIQYVVDPGTFSINLSVTLDVIIGTVPLYNMESVVPRVTNPSHQQIGFEHWVIPNKYGNEPTAPMAPPPTYDECLRTRESVKTSSKTN